MTPGARAEKGDLLVREGRIARLGVLEASETGGVPCLDASGCAVLPGLVQTHLHLCQTLFRGLAEGLDLLSWLATRVLPLEAAHDEASMRASAELAALELLLGGTTAVLTMESVRHAELVVDVLEASGLHGATGRCLVDREEGAPAGFARSKEAELEETVALGRRIQARHGGRIGFAFNPRFALSCSEGLLREGTLAARELGARLHTHCAESPHEIARVREETGLSNVAYLHEVGLTGPDVTLAHCVHLSPEDLRTLAGTGTHVAHCPSSNLKLGSGIAPVSELLHGGIGVSLGADGAACNNELDAFQEMRLMGLLAGVRSGPGSVSPRQVLEAATVKGAAALGRRDVGTLEPGLRANLTVVDLTGPHVQPLGEEEDPERIETALVYSARGGDVRATVIDGRILVRDRVVAHLDRERILARAREERRRLLSRAGIS
jgi:cytosine/adenosine deaminase-related metal-dependent hydrolase